MTLLEALAALPDSWALVAVDGQKRAYQPGWQNNPLTKDQAAAEIRAGRAKAIGVIAGPPSGGLLFVDLDGISAAEKLDKLGLPVRSLPKSPAVTSGRDGRFQIIYSVPPEYWPAMKGRRVFKTGKLDAHGKAENLDLRWAGHYSVVIGAHPETSGYRWLRDRSPETQPFSDAPTALIELLLEQPKPDPAPLLAQPAASRTTELLPPVGGPLPFLDFITRTSRDLIESGGTPGSWNDDQLALALDLLGTESWILAQGHNPDITARDAFSSHIAAARLKTRDFDERKAWHRFDGAVDLNPTPGTPLDKLLSRLAYHTRFSRPILQPQKSGPPPRDPQSHRSQPVGTSPTHTDSRPYAPTFDKPSKLEAAELLYMLRSQAGHDGIRFNVFTQQIEIEGRVLTGADRYYLRLAQQGFKVPKDLAFDCLVDVAHEHPYDPVALYLDHVAATVPPTYIDSLATTYLRPEDHIPGGKPTLYDHMLKATLIGAVRRVFEPGCKHDTACVLMGDQGARKSSFWSVLGGEFFSDALKDISSKDDLMVMHRSWIMEWAELDHITSRKHAGHVKAFLSQATDLYRKPYGKATEDFPRRGIIVGSTNRSTGFLVDDTGNRRFWVIPTAKNEADPIDTAQLMAERDAIWAAAVIAYRAGELNYLPPELAQQVTSENESYQVDNPWRAPLEAWLRAPDNRIRPITSELLLTEAIQKPIERQTRADQMQVGSILRELGYEKRRQVVDGVLRWVYFQP